MSILPTLTEIGQLEIIEVYEFIDKPVLFACRNGSDQIFIAVLTDENDSLTTWLYVSLSRRRFELMRSGGLDLHDAFALSEDGFVRAVNVDKINNESIIELIQTSQLSDDDLPLAGEFLKIPTATVPPLDAIERRDGVDKMTFTAQRLGVMIGGVEG
jgi:hypothetical protein